MVNHRPIERALLSASNKSGLVELAQQLTALSIEIIATGGTATLLKQHQIAVTDVAEYTGFPEMMGGRLKTLHPKIHGGLLGRRGVDDAIMQQHQIKPIDLVVINLYPFQETISQPSTDLTQAIEQIDIGGPCLLRAAAKNYQDVTVIVDPNDYALIRDELQNQGTTTQQTRQYLAQKAFAHTAQYDQIIADYLKSHMAPPSQPQALFPEHLHTHLHKTMDLRYGENPHQQAALYTSTHSSETQLSLIQGKPLSFNNLLDGDCALQTARNLDPQIPSCVIVKHSTPCGVGQASSLCEAYLKAFACDPQSAFGGIIATNSIIDADTAHQMLDKQFIEVVIAPGFTDQAKQLFTQRVNLRLLTYPDTISFPQQVFHSITNGLLVQENDQPQLAPHLDIVTSRQPTATDMINLRFAWQVVSMVKSNAIVLAENQATIGIGSGQTSRVFALKTALLKAQEANLNSHGAVMASDAFFPFADSIHLAAEHGITAVIQPGGSKRDSEVIAAADQANIAMVFTHTRHFRH